MNNGIQLIVSCVTLLTVVACSSGSTTSGGVPEGELGSGDSGVSSSARASEEPASDEHISVGDDGVEPQSVDSTGPEQVQVRVQGSRSRYAFYRKVEDENRGRLDDAFERNDLEALRSYFESWSADFSEKKTLSTKTTPVIIIDTYKIFSDFYDPDRLARITDGKFGDDELSGYGYVIVQGEMWISRRASFKKRHPFEYEQPAIFELVIKDFFPDLHIPWKKPVYLTERDDLELTDFLGDEQHPSGASNLMTPAIAKGKSRSRMQFLGKLVKIIKGHWEGWQLVTHPRVLSIDFNADGTAALVSFRVRYQGGEARYEKVGSEWKMVSSGLTWIE